MRENRLRLAAVVFALAATAEAQSPAPTTGHEGHMAAASGSSPARVLKPPPVLGQIPLVDSLGQGTSLRDVTDVQGPVFLNFIFTTCTTVCPVMSAGFGQFQKTLEKEGDRALLLSISIDPDLDTVPRLKAYAARHRAGASWRFLTGTAKSVEAAQRAFGAYRGDKNNHVPATYFRRGRNAPWQVVPGLANAGTLVSLLRGAP